MKINTKELTQLSIFAAIMVAGKELLSFIPNVNPVSLIIILLAINYSYKALFPVAIFVIIEIAIYGFDLWSFMYLYVWPLITIGAIIFRTHKSRIFWACYGAAAGFLFGALCSIPYIFVGGFKAAFAYWIAGIPYDLIHSVSNFVLIFTLMPLLNKLIIKFK